MREQEEPKVAPGFLARAARRMKMPLTNVGCCCWEESLGWVEEGS